MGQLNLFTLILIHWLLHLAHLLCIWTHKDCALTASLIAHPVSSEYATLVIIQWEYAASSDNITILSLILVFHAQTIA